MLHGLRAVAVVIVIILGLVAQGVGMPAMAASSMTAEQGSCHLLSAKCADMGGDRHAAVNACQPTCIVPATVPRRALDYVPVAWTKPGFPAVTEALPSGWGRAPDPFPPKSPRFA